MKHKLLILGKEAGNIYQIKNINFNFKEHKYVLLGNYYDNMTQYIELTEENIYQFYKYLMDVNWGDGTIIEISYETDIDIINLDKYEKGMKVWRIDADNNYNQQYENDNQLFNVFKKYM